jgi:hypothetical protein
MFLRAAAAYLYGREGNIKREWEIIKKFGIHIMLD